jgi:membrane protein involved in colicin uptake
MNDISQISQVQSDKGFGFSPFAKLGKTIDINRLPTQAEAEAKRAEEQAKRIKEQAEREAAEAEAKQAEAEAKSEEPKAEKVIDEEVETKAETPAEAQAEVEAKAEEAAPPPKSEDKPKAKAERPFGPNAVSAILASEAKKRDQGDELATCLAAGDFVMRRVLRNHRDDEDADEQEARVFSFVYRAHQRAGQDDKKALRLTKAWMKEVKRPPKFTVEVVTHLIAQTQPHRRPGKATWIRATLQEEQERYETVEMIKLEAAIVEALRPPKFTPQRVSELVKATLLSKKGPSPVDQARWILDVVAKDGRYSIQEQHDLRSAAKIALKSVRMAMAKPATNAILEQLLKGGDQRRQPKPAGLHGGPKPKEPASLFATANQQPERELSPEQREALIAKQQREAEAAKAERIQRQAEAEAARKRRGYGEMPYRAPRLKKNQDQGKGKDGKGNKGKGGKRDQRAA